MPTIASPVEHGRSALLTPFDIPVRNGVVVNDGGVEQIKPMPRLAEAWNPVAIDLSSEPFEVYVGQSCQPTVGIVQKPVWVSVATGDTLPSPLTFAHLMPTPRWSRMVTPMTAVPEGQ
jgi:hypothetical protein